MISTITSKAESIVGSRTLLNHLNQITEPDSLGQSKDTDNVAYITEDVRGFVSESRPQIQKMTNSTSSLITKIDSVAGDIKSFTSSFKGNVTADQISRTFSAIDSTVHSLKSLAENLSLMVVKAGRISRGMENIRGFRECQPVNKVLAENPSLLLKGESQRGRRSDEKG